VNVLALVGPAVAKRVGPLAALLVVWLVVRRLRRFG
jgi:hypothetical protein